MQAQPNIRLLAERFDVLPLIQQLYEHPDLWDRYPWRTEHPKSPHREVSDIWVRYNAIENMGPHFNEPHVAVWYPVCEVLPAAKQLALEVKEAFGAHALGGVLLTRIPASKQVYPHADGGWHATHYEKVAVQIAGNERQAFCFDGSSVSALPGESYLFNNQAPHWVRNDSDEDRITLICCIRRNR
jgi:hypothetical protein